MWKNRRNQGSHAGYGMRRGECRVNRGEGRCLLDLEPGQKAEVRKICCHHAIKHRLMDMGLVPGAEVELVRYAPMGDPVVIKVCNYLLSLRKSESFGILV